MKGGIRGIFILRVRMPVDFGMRLYAITDRRLLPGSHESGHLSTAERDGLVGLAAEWAELGVEFVQLREKDLGKHDLTELARAMMAAMRDAGAGRPQLLINAGAAGAAEAARSVCAAGIHLPGRWRAEQVGAARIVGTVSVGATRWARWRWRGQPGRTLRCCRRFLRRKAIRRRVHWGWRC